MLFAENLIRDNSITQYFDIYEPTDYTIVLGRSRTVESDVYEENCKLDNVKIVKRISGGGTILLAPGMFAWSLIIPTQKICLNQTKWFNVLLNWVINILSSIEIKNIEAKGISDLTINNKKISGTALYIGAKKVLYHGTLLIDIDLLLFEKYIKMPDKMPEYRQNRKHSEFVTTLKILGYQFERDEIKNTFELSKKPDEKDYWGK
jgi:lipoate-protein ligase A